MVCLAQGRGMLLPPSLRRVVTSCPPPVTPFPGSKAPRSSQTERSTLWIAVILVAAPGRTAPEHLAAILSTVPAQVMLSPRGGPGYLAQWNPFFLPGAEGDTQAEGA
jgi:hypothetical protein